MSTHVENITKSEIVEALSNMDKATIKRYKKLNKKPNIDNFPGDRGLPLVGHMYWLLKDIRTWMDQNYSKHGPVFQFRTPFLDALFLLGPDANKLLLQNEDQLFSNYLSWGPIFHGIFDNAVLALDFSHHKKSRKFLQMAFKREAIEGHMELMNPLIKNGINKWSTQKPIKALPHVKQLLLDTAANVFLGIEIGSESNQINQAFNDILGRTVDPFQNENIPFSPFAKARKGRKFLESFVNKNIAARRKTKGRDLFSQLCHLKDEDGLALSDEEIRDQIIFVLFAAHDTTTSSLCGILHSLASNLPWQEELRAEMQAIKKDVMEFDDSDEMPKTTMTIQEGLRLYPPITLIPRNALDDFEFAGQTIPKGTQLFLSPTFCHRMPEYWSNPNQFDPERFSPERAEDKKDFFQYIPFGGGAHKCIGMHFAQVQSKIFLFHLLRNYKVSLNSKSLNYAHNNIPMALPKDGLPIVLTKI